GRAAGWRRRRRPGRRAGSSPRGPRSRPARRIPRPGPAVPRRPDFADPPLVDPGRDPGAAEPRPGGVVAVVGAGEAAGDRLAVADRDREEEVRAGAAVERVDAAVVGQRVVAGPGQQVV